MEVVGVDVICGLRKWIPWYSHTRYNEQVLDQGACNAIWKPQGSPIKYGSKNLDNRVLQIRYGHNVYKTLSAAETVLG